MIVKAISHKSPTKSAIGKLINYIFDPEKLKDNTLNREPLISKRNILGYNQNKWIDSFKTNDDKRSFEHSKRTVIRHEIVSFSDKDNHLLTREALKAISKWYLKHRSPNSLGVCAVHYEKSIHIHFAISGVGLDGKSTRISRKAFTDFKIKLQEFQKEHYPFLSNSIVQHSKKKA